ncbi:hypothetical protein ACVQK1_09440 [Edwardsiella tarda]
MRKQITYIVEDNNRDHGKEFIITEMSSGDGDEMATELYRTMMKGGFYEIPQDIIAMGCAGLATMGMNVLALASADTYRILRSRLLDTVEIVIRHDGNQQTRKVMLDDFEEVSTIRTLMDKVFQENFGFLTIAAA